MQIPGNFVTAMAKTSWQKQAAAKVADTASKIPVDWRLSSDDLQRAKEQKKLAGPFIESFLEDHEIAIISLDSLQLVAKLAEGALTCLEVTQAYCKTTAIAHQINNCLHEIFFDQALERATALDRYLKEHGKPSGPLHGLPVSLKDQFHVKGVDTTMGFIGWINTYEGDGDPKKVHTMESQVVEELLQQGAVIYCKTSLPQTLMCGETINNLIGQTLNPINQGLSCGGSSGGEGALQALRGSSVGLGTDIGGSVRIPATFCGIYSLKPTHNRLSYRNAANTNPGQLNGPSSVGVMATSVDALKLVASALISTQPWMRDPQVVPLPWRSEIEQSIFRRTDNSGKAVAGREPLKLGILSNDGFMTPHPPIQRGLSVLRQALIQAGHTVVDWHPPSHKAAADIHLQFILSDGGHYIHEQLRLSGEPLISPLRELFELKPPVSAITTEDLSVQARDACEAYSDYWNTMSADGQGVDAFIMPVAPHAAVIPGHYLYTGYTEAINLLDYSASVIPVTVADKDVDVADPDYVPLNDLDAQNWRGYDPERYDGAPVGLQIVGRRYEEEKVWAIAKILDTIMRNPL